MAVLLYAAPDDLLTGEWLESAPADAKALIRHASLLVDEACRFDEYVTDADGRPTDPTILAAFRDATCQQVATWAAAGINPVAGAVGQAPQIASQSTEGDSVSYTNQPTAAALSAAIDTLCRASVLILRAEGLCSRVPGVL